MPEQLNILLVARGPKLNTILNTTQNKVCHYCTEIQKMVLRHSTPGLIWCVNGTTKGKTQKVLQFKDLVSWLPANTVKREDPPKGNAEQRPILAIQQLLFLSLYYRGSSGRKVS